MAQKVRFAVVGELNIAVCQFAFQRCLVDSLYHVSSFGGSGFINQ